jgi:hypothetical protein
MRFRELSRAVIPARGKSLRQAAGRACWSLRIDLVKFGLRGSFELRQRVLIVAAMVTTTSSSSSERGHGDGEQDVHAGFEHHLLYQGND